MRLTDLTPWKPYRGFARAEAEPFDALRQQMDRLFADFLGPFDVLERGNGNGGDGNARRSMIAPRLDVSETDKAYEVTVELPGVEEKDLDVSVWDGVLTIKGEKRWESEDKKKDFQRIERRYGSFERQLSLPSEINAERIDANFHNGLLTVSVPKSKKAQATAKRIAVKSN